MTGVVLRGTVEAGRGWSSWRRTPPEVHAHRRGLKQISELADGHFTAERISPVTVIGSLPEYATRS